MKKLILLLGALIAANVYAQLANIKIKVTSIKSTNGDLLISLYKNEQDFPIDPAKAYKSEKIGVSGSNLKYVFNILPFGTYAITITHDVIANGKLDTNFIGMSKEGIATSNSAKGNLGPPKFSEAKSEHGK